MTELPKDVPPDWKYRAETYRGQVYQLELQLSAAMEANRKLEAQIGSPPPGSDPAEAVPRDETWHKERANWTREVERLREYARKLEADLADERRRREEHDAEMEYHADALAKRLEEAVGLVRRFYGAMFLTTLGSDFSLKPDAEAFLAAAKPEGGR